MNERSEYVYRCRMCGTVFEIDEDASKTVAKVRAHMWNVHGVRGSSIVEQVKRSVVSNASGDT